MDSWVSRATRLARCTAPRCWVPHNSDTSVTKVDDGRWTDMTRRYLLYRIPTYPSTYTYLSIYLPTYPSIHPSIYIFTYIYISTPRAGLPHGAAWWSSPLRYSWGMRGWPLSTQTRCTPWLGLGLGLGLGPGLGSGPRLGHGAPWLWFGGAPWLWFG